MLKKENLTPHTWLSHKSSSVGEDGANLAACSIHTKDHPNKKMLMTALPCKKREYIEKMKLKKEGKRKERKES
jgi:hypothetical protein